MEDFSTCGPSITCKYGSHMMCLLCLELYVKEEAAFNQQRIAANKGKLCCPGQSCANVFEHHELAQHLSPASFAELLSAWQLCIEQTAVLAAEERAKEEAAAEASKSAVAKARSHIIDDLLTLKCSRCHKAFEDFDGCFAVHCKDMRGHGCRAHICAYCLEYSIYAGEAHRHVRSCSHNTTKDRSLYSTRKGFTAAQKQRRTTLVQQYVKTLPLELQLEVVASVQRELADLGIDLRQQLQPVRQVRQQQQPLRQTLREAATAAAQTAARAAAATALLAQHSEEVCYELMQTAFPYAAVPAAAVFEVANPGGLGREPLPYHLRPNDWVHRYWKASTHRVPQLHCNVAVGLLAASLVVLFRHEVSRS
jgi:pyruvate/2-oxoglutarate dehydrogenase complex dihydrolipoamide acyltransferase (E2) component